MDVMELAARLPQTTPPSVMDESAGCSIGIETQIDYVPPQLIPVDTSVRFEDARAILVTAPAAAGKSTSGKAMASHANAVYLDLSKQRVAAGSFTGLLDMAFGEDPSLAYRKRLRAGAATLVVDALDETQVASQEVAFYGFITGMARYLRLSEGSGNVVLLARIDTSTYILEAFRQENVPIIEYEIDYFNKDQGDKFIDLKLDRLYEEKQTSPVHRQHRSHYETARDTLFGRLAKTLGHPDPSSAWKSAEGRRLLGYSPVLEGIASYLCVPDFRKLEVAENEPASGSFAEWRMLTRLMHDLLEREQGKFLSSWPDEMQKPMFTGESEIRRLYNPQEQCEKLLARVHKLSTAPIQPLVPHQLEGSYTDAVASQLLNHPFLSSSSKFVNTLFDDFACALTLHRSGDHKMVASLLRKLRSANSLPSPALGPFIISLADDSSIQADWVDLVIASIASRDDAKTSHRYSINLAEERGVLEIDNLQEGILKSAMHLPLATENRNIRMPARSKNSDVSGAAEVSFTGQNVHLGPFLEVSAEIISFQGPELTIDASKPVIFEASMVIADWDQTITIYGDDLSLLSDEAEGWPQRYSRARPQIGSAEDDTDYLRSLRGIVKHFRATQHVDANQLAASRDELDSYVLKTDDRARRIVNEIIDHGWWKQVGPAYILDRALFDHLQSSQAAIHSYELSPAMSKFFQSARKRIF